MDCPELCPFFCEVKLFENFVPNFLSDELPLNIRKHQFFKIPLNITKHQFFKISLNIRKHQLFKNILPRFTIFAQKLSLSYLQKTFCFILHEISGKTFVIQLSPSFSIKFLVKPLQLSSALSFSLNFW